MKPTLWILTTLLGMAAAAAASAAPGLAIEIPADRGSVAVSDTVSGTADLGVRKVWVVVHQTDTDLCWVQGPVEVRADQTWTLKGQFGQPGAKRTGVAYELRALSRPRGPIEAGSAPCGQEAGLLSDAVYLTGK